MCPPDVHRDAWGYPDFDIGVHRDRLQAYGEKANLLIPGNQFLVGEFRKAAKAEDPGAKLMGYDNGPNLIRDVETNGVDVMTSLADFAAVDHESDGN